MPQPLPPDSCQLPASCTQWTGACKLPAFNVVQSQLVCRLLACSLPVTPSQLLPFCVQAPLAAQGLSLEHWKVDGYGHAMHWYAKRGSLAAWAVDHWFPVSRGGLSQVPNLRVISADVNLVKSDK